MAPQDRPFNGLFGIVHDRCAVGFYYPKRGIGNAAHFRDYLFYGLLFFDDGTGEKFAKEDTLTPFAGMWLATFILVPIGLFLTYKAMRDSQLFNKEWYYRTAQSVRKYILVFQKRKQ